MNIKESIQAFPQQFLLDPVVKNEEKLKSHKKFIILGMGGSHLAADLLSMEDFSRDIIIHRDYGLPHISEDDLKNSLVLAVSYSGNTEEVLDGLEIARQKGLSCAAVTTGGKLLAKADELSLPYVLLPNSGDQPRMALGVTTKALLKLMREEQALSHIFELSTLLQNDALETLGKEFAEIFRGYIPLVYASTRNTPLAQIWKIIFNETGKIPAFWNVFPELNHNEMTGFDGNSKTLPLSNRFYGIFLADKFDHPRIRTRMDILSDLYRQRGVQVQILDLEGKTVFHKIFNSLLLANWIAYYIAIGNNADPEKVPLVEDFKKLLG
ncbi:MAG: Bifunctional phosphoglucose/phosphomannose isomerase [Parcubacteria group bacterium GW2011_GWC1_41_7]|nr:MAG: Bifunctional phosphoglucose/phosphomannose isomerase [Parcubacteria group bacterium GW2011_GWC1_41_7]